LNFSALPTAIILVQAAVLHR